MTMLDETIFFSHMAILRDIHTRLKADRPDNMLGPDIRGLDTPVPRVSFMIVPGRLATTYTAIQQRNIWNCQISACRNACFRFMAWNDRYSQGVMEYFDIANPEFPENVLKRVEWWVVLPLRMEMSTA
jgi:hypothetical protein